MSNSVMETHARRNGTYASSLLMLVAKAIRQQAERIRHQRQIRRDTNKLMEMDDRTLADIGLSRSEIMYAVSNGRG
jgi:uncharacterized protein YjiS (DUF1127 family)